MKLFLLTAALMGALAMAAPLPAGAAVQAERDWTAVVAQTPEGGYRMGNPDAPVKLIEYLSLTCPLCARFSAEGVPPLVQRYVKSGRVSLEYRNFYLNGYDLMAALVSRCAAPDDYFAITGEILREQEQWIHRIQSLDQNQRDAIRALGPAAGMARVAALSGMEAIAARHDVTPARLQACLADRSMAARLTAMRDSAGSEMGVHQTPSFAMNGRLVEGVHDWAALEPLLTPDR